MKKSLARLQVIWQCLALPICRSLVFVFCALAAPSGWLQVAFQVYHPTSGCCFKKPGAEISKRKFGWDMRIEGSDKTKTCRQDRFGGKSWKPHRWIRRWRTLRAALSPRGQGHPENCPRRRLATKHHKKISRGEKWRERNKSPNSAVEMGKKFLRAGFKWGHIQVFPSLCLYFFMT